MTAFAEVTDIETLTGKTFTESESARVEMLIEMASAKLVSFVHIDEDDEHQAETLHNICCAMVARAYGNGDTTLNGVTQQSMTAVGFTQQYSYSNPSNDLYLTADEKRELGIKGRGKGRSLLPWGDSYELV
jgi:hypothetical protein